MMKVKDILSQSEREKVARLKFLMLTTSSIFEARRCKRRIEKILLDAKKRYMHLA